MLNEGRFQLLQSIQNMFLAVTSLTKQSSKRQIEGCGVMGFREKQVFFYYFDIKFGFRAYSAFLAIFILWNHKKMFLI